MLSSVICLPHNTRGGRRSDPVSRWDCLMFFVVTKGHEARSHLNNKNKKYRGKNLEYPLSIWRHKRAMEIKMWNFCSRWKGFDITVDFNGCLSSAFKTKENKANEWLNGNFNNPPLAFFCPLLWLPCCCRCVISLSRDFPLVFLGKSLENSLNYELKNLAKDHQTSK